jgi:hypothetical protein
MRKLKSIFLAAGVIAAMLLPTLALTTMSASAAVTSGTINNDLCAGSNLTLDTTGATSCPTASTTSFQALLEKIINIFTVVVGVIAVVMIIVGGLRYITSGGEASKVGGAKTTIIYALIGLVVVALAQVVVHFVLNQSAGITG